MNILFVDHDATSRMIGRASIEAMGQTVFEASDGVEALAVLEREKIDAIISDILMPNMDGYSLCRAVRTHERFCCLPFIFHTSTYTSPGDEAFSTELGADDFIKKPAPGAKLLAAIRAAIPQAQLRRPKPQTAPEQLDLIKRYNERLVAKLEQKNAELERRTGELHAVLSSSLDAIITMNQKGLIVEFNPAAQRIFGHKREDVLGRMLADVIIPPSMREAHRRGIARLAATGEGRMLGRRIELTALRADGTEFPVELAINRIVHLEPPLYTGFIRDITESKGATEDLRESEARFRQLAENITEVFWLTDVQKNLMIYISPGYEKIWGRTCESLYLNPTTWVESIHPDDRANVWEAARSKQAAGTYDEIYRITRPDGSQRWIHDRAFPVRNEAGEIYRMAGIAQDITEQRSLEEKLRQAQKMDAIGQLAGGVAHDFNNILTVILGYAQILLAEGQSSPESAEPLTQILEAADRASRLTRQLLTFSRKQEIRPQFLDLNELVGDVGKMLRRLIGEHISLQINHAPDLPPVLADAGMLEQVLLNLAVNARDAMPKGGQLSIATRTVRINEVAARTIPGSRAGDFVGLSVQDTGTGMPPEVISRIFEPFYTTKEQGKGTGLGLATVYGIVQRHEGWIEVQSRVDEGTTFNVFLPAARHGSTADRAEEVARKVRGGTETILLVEDETAVRGLATIVLQKHGYRVLEAPSGHAALEIWKQHAAEVDLLLTDLVMPGGMTGMDLAEKLRASNPKLKVIYSSGYSTELTGQILESQEGKHFLQKPYHPQDLAETVRKVLDQPG